jgi:hypothetical protein
MNKIPFHDYGVFYFYSWVGHFFGIELKLGVWELNWCWEGKGRENVYGKCFEMDVRD